MNCCGTCGNGKKAGGATWCLLLGIMIRSSYSGCKYFREKDEGNATAGDRNELDAPATKEAG